jgi:hypothetical protein
MVNDGNQIHNFVSRSGSGTVIYYGSGSDFLTSYGSGSTSQKVMVPKVPVPQRWKEAKPMRIQADPDPLHKKVEHFNMKNIL